MFTVAKLSVLLAVLLSALACGGSTSNPDTKPFTWEVPDMDGVVVEVYVPLDWAWNTKADNDFPGSAGKLLYHDVDDGDSRVTIILDYPLSKETSFDRMKRSFPEDGVWEEEVI